MFPSTKFHMDIFKNSVWPRCTRAHFPIEILLPTKDMEMYVSVFFYF